MARGPYKAVFYDVDGTIVLTEERNQTVISALAEKYGAKIKDTDWETLGGQPETVVWAHLAPQYPDFAAAISAEDFMAESRAISMKNDFKLAARPGIVDTMCYMKARGIKMAAVSNAPYDAVVKSLHDSASRNFMDFIISEDDVLAAGRRQKPAPDPYLMAAAKMGVAPQECLVIEDSLAGVKAAKAAGMTVIQIVDKKLPTDLAADAYAYDRESLLDLCTKFMNPKPFPPRRPSFKP